MPRAKSRQNLRESTHTLSEARGLLSGTIKRGPLSKNRKNRLDLVNIEAKRQTPANPHLIRRLAGLPGPPQTIFELTQSGSAHDKTTRPRTRYRFSASPESPRRKASDEVPILRLARGPTHKASDEVPILRLARGPTPQGLGRGTDSLICPRPHATRPWMRYRFSDLLEAPCHKASDEVPIL